MVEIHPDPVKAISEELQSLRLLQFGKLTPEIEKIN
jgi:3-deoxy-D-arabino-heptulosonate 7-phosphate (DAHP) synthase